MPADIFCSICLEEGVLERLPCNCKFCNICLQSWFTEQIQRKVGINPDIPILSCPNQTCGSSYYINQLYNNELPVSNLKDIDELIVKKSLAGESYYRACPKNGCNYIGYVTKTPCRQDLICEKCGFCWKDKSLKTWDMNFKDNIIRLLSFDTKEIASTLYENIMTNECVGCEIKILKNGGCPHMTCKNCSFEFCWICLQPQGHSGFHKPAICFTTFLTKVFILILLSTLFSVKVGIFSFMWNLFKSATYYFFTYILIANSGILACFGIIFQIGELIKLARGKASNNFVNRYKITKFCLVIFKYILPMVFLVLYITWIFYYWTIWELLTFYIKEAIVCLTIFVFGRKLKLLLASRF